MHHNARRDDARLLRVVAVLAGGGVLATLAVDPSSRFARVGAREFAPLEHPYSSIFSALARLRRMRLKASPHDEASPGAACVSGKTLGREHGCPAAGLHLALAQVEGMARNALFVGRERELAALTELRKDTARGPRFVLVGGEAGVGKSRLLAEFRRTLPQRAIVFGVGECADVAPAPFAPFIAMFTPFAPEIAQRLSRTPPIVTHGEAATRALFDDVRRAVEELAAKRALLLYLEDVHFADSGTLALLAHLARACQGPRLLAIVTYRLEALDQSDEFVATIARLVRLPNVTAIDLPPLSQRDARALVTGTIRADLAADARLVDALVARADGNAFFLEELVAHAAERSGDEAAPLPRSISAVIRERFGTLPASDRTLLTHAAVFGRRFDIELLRKVVDADRDELLAALRRARDAGLAVEEPGDAQRLRFRHALTREAIVSGLLTLQRRPLHARILVVLEALSADERDAYGSELAYHALEAHDPDKALRYGEAAGA